MTGLSKKALEAKRAQARAGVVDDERRRLIRTAELVRSDAPPAAQGKAPVAVVARNGETVADPFAAEVAPYVTPIARMWETATNNLIDIGRQLNLAKKALNEHGKFMRMCREFLPFSIEVAHQLRTVAEAIDRKRFKEEELPTAYSVAYQICTIPDAAIDRARELGLVRPDVRRSELLAFKSQLRDPKPPRRVRPEREIAELRSEREGLAARIKEIDRRLAELEGGPTIDGTATVLDVGD